VWALCAAARGSDEADTFGRKQGATTSLSDSPDAQALEPAVRRNNLCHIGGPSSAGGGSSGDDYARGKWVEVDQITWDARVAAATLAVETHRGTGSGPASVAEALAGYSCMTGHANGGDSEESWMCSRRAEFPHGVDNSSFWRHTEEGGEDLLKWERHVLKLRADEARVLRALRWEWQPSDCSLVPFDAGKFRQLLGAGTLFMVGDSLTEQQWASLACLLGVTDSERGVHSDPIQALSEAAEEHFNALLPDGEELLGAPQPVFREVGNQPQSCDRNHTVIVT
jgi:hypothetical protein